MRVDREGRRVPQVGDLGAGGWAQPLPRAIHRALARFTSRGLPGGGAPAAPRVLSSALRVRYRPSAAAGGRRGQRIYSSDAVATRVAFRGGWSHRPSGELRVWPPGCGGCRCSVCRRSQRQVVGRQARLGGVRVAGRSPVGHGARAVHGTPSNPRRHRLPRRSPRARVCAAGRCPRVRLRSRGVALPSSAVRSLRRPGAGR
mmetsp:Transcript_31083/g.89869  ORF Transcript_31083/g.89869 Transcript_31083/m.89869 type:complete len:201 (-) Transcript_31083:230-832(-)